MLKIGHNCFELRGLWFEKIEKLTLLSKILIESYQLIGVLHP